MPGLGVAAGFPPLAGEMPKAKGARIILICSTLSKSKPDHIRTRHTMNLDIFYDPESDTLDIGNGKPAHEGYDVAEQLTAHVDAQGDVVFVSLEHAVEVLAPYLSEYMAQREPRQTASLLRDEGEPI